MHQNAIYTIFTKLHLIFLITRPCSPPLLPVARWPSPTYNCARRCLDFPSTKLKISRIFVYFLPFELTDSGPWNSHVKPMTRLWVVNCDQRLQKKPALKGGKAHMHEVKLCSIGTSWEHLVEQHVVSAIIHSSRQRTASLRTRGVGTPHPGLKISAPHSVGMQRVLQ